MGAVASAAKVAIRTTEGGSINAGIWTLVGLIVTTLGVVAVAYIKQRGPWKRVSSDERASDFDRLRDEITAQKGDIAKLYDMVAEANKAAAEANQHAMRSDAKLQSALTACEVLLSLVEREMPDAKEIALVKRLLAQAASADMGVGDGMRRIARMKGVSE